MEYNFMKINLTDNQISYLSHVLQSVEQNSTIDAILNALDEAQNALFEADDLINSCNYELSDNQIQFVRDVVAAGKEVNFDYSGRSMFGKPCPAVTLNFDESFLTDAQIAQDSLGLGTVIYARH
jgi:hypothetical protein